MEESLKQIKELFRRMDNLFIFLIAIQVFLAVTAYFVVAHNYLSPWDSFQNPLRLMVILSNTIALVASRFAFRFFMKNKNPNAALSVKTEQFKNLTVVRFGLLTIDNLINITVFVFSQSYVILLIVLVILVLFIAYRPLPKLFNKEYDENLNFPE